jgi:Lar family restriction alleviation protein
MRTIMEDKEILPCPFCGSNKISVICKYYFYCFCDDCEAEGSIKESREEAIEAWNKRKGV